MPEPSYPGEFKERLTSEDIAKINKALEACNGGVAAAADVLGMTAHRVSYAITHNPSLNARWKSSSAVLNGETVINPVTTINRTPPQPLNLTPVQQQAVELSVTDRKLTRSLHKLGFKQQEIQAISSVEEFAGQHFEQTLSIMHGGLLKSAMRLMLLAEKIERDYLQDPVMEEKDRKWWWGIYFEILEKLRGMNDQTNKAALTKALIEIKKKDQNGLGKPGFSPHTTTAIQINVRDTDSVKTNTPNGPIVQP